MPHKFYLKGRRKEYKIVSRLKKEGFDIVQRTAGSHSPVDIIAIDIQKGIIRLIQSKSDDLNATKAQKIRDANRGLNGIFQVYFSVI